jgi:hypothetical protein
MKIKVLGVLKNGHFKMSKNENLNKVLKKG